MSSDSERDEASPPAPRAKRFKFASFAQQVAQLDVDVARKLIAVRTTPRPGFSSFTQETLATWREINTAKHFTELADRLEPLLRTLPQLLHHSTRIVQELHDALAMEAALSLDAILALLPAVARDLQQDFVQWLHPTVHRLHALLDAGADADAELLGGVMRCLSALSKHMAPHLVADPAVLLHATRGLRHHAADHVRVLTAEAVAPVVRQCQPDAMRAALVLLLRECVLAPHEEVVLGTAALLAEALKGVHHTMHSRSSVLLQLLLDDALLPHIASTLQPTTQGTQRTAPRRSGRRVSSTGAARRDEDGGVEQEGAEANDVAHGRVRAVAAVTLDRVWEHLRRGGCADAWTAVVGDATRALDALLQGGDAVQAAQCRCLARSLALVSQGLEYHRGGRVEDYSPLYTLTQRVLTTSVADAVHGDGGEWRDEALDNLGGDLAPLARPHLPAAVRRLVLAMVAAHGKVVGASMGLPALDKGVGALDKVFTIPPDAFTLATVEAFLHPPVTSPAVLRRYGPTMLRVLGSLLLGNSEQPRQGAWVLLPRVLNAMQPAPLLAAVPGIGGDLATLVVSTATGATHLDTDATTAERWLAVQALASACASPKQLRAASVQALTAASAVAEASADASDAVRMLLGQCWRGVAACVQSMPAAQLRTLDGQALRAAAGHASSAPLLLGVAAYVATRGADQFPPDAMESLLPTVQVNLASPDAALRVATLHVLCALPQPSIPTPPDVDPVAHVPSPSTVLSALREAAQAKQSLEGGRAAALALGQVQHALEYGRVPAGLLDAVVLGLVGALHTRYAMVWPAASSALTMALTKHPAAVWPHVCAALAEAQQSLLQGTATAAAGNDGSTGGDSSGVSMQPLEAMQVAVNTLVDRGATDAGTRLKTILSAIKAAGGVALSVCPHDWTCRFLDMMAAKPGAANHSSSQWRCAAGGKAWRAAAVPWLQLVGSYKGVKTLPNAKALCDAVAYQLSDHDSAVQTAAIHCLKAFKVPFVSPYIDHLLRFASPKTLRGALTTFDLTGQQDDGLAEQHRAGLVPVLIMVLFPSLRKRTGRLAGKGAPGSARAAVLNYLAAARPEELATLLELLLRPMAACFVQAQGVGGASDVEASMSLLTPPWWARLLPSTSLATWLTVVDRDALARLPLRQKQGMLHALQDLVTHCGATVTPYVPAMLALTVALLDTVVLPGAGNHEGGDAMDVDHVDRVDRVDRDNAEEEEEEDNEEMDVHTEDGDSHLQGVDRKKGGTSSPMEGRKALTSGSLRLMALLLRSYPAAHDLLPLWPRLMPCTAALLPRVLHEAASPTPPALLELAASLAGSSHLAPVLADRPSTMADVAQWDAVPAWPAAPPPWACAGQGSALLHSCLAALGTPSCSDVSAASVLSLIEAVLQQPGYGPALLQPHLSTVLAVLQARIQGPAGPGAPSKDGDRSDGAGAPSAHAAEATALVVQRGKVGGRSVALRALGIVELLSEQLSLEAHGVALATALQPVLQSCARRHHAPSSELTAARTLRVLSACWRSVQGGAVAMEASTIEAFLRALASLTGSLSDRPARAALCDAVSALAPLHAPLAPVAALLPSLNAWDASTVEDIDYHTRIEAYGTCRRPLWSALDPLPATVLLHQCFLDLRNADDLSLRQAAATALEHAVDAAHGSAALLSLLPSVVYGQLKRGLPAVSLAVRQEHVLLLRRCVLAAPDAFEGLHVLVDEDVEVDFFHNVAHLQLHRRMRALHRLQLLAGQLSVGALMGVAGPLLQQILLQGIGGENSRHEGKQADKDRESSLADNAVAALGAVAAALPWQQYRQLLGIYLRRLNRAEAGSASKHVIRAVCAILDAFHFLPDRLASGASAPDEPRPQAAPDAASASAVMDVEERRAIERQLVERVLPSMAGVLVQGDVVRAPVGLALVKLLRLLPEEVQAVQLPRTLRHVANVLKSRAQGVRDGARQVLVAMAVELGPSFLPYVFNVLTDALPDKGYTSHVLGFTTHAVLAAVAANSPPPGAMDVSLPLVLPIVETELFGQVADAKEAGALAGSYKEAARGRGCDTYQLCASLITVQDSIAALLEPVNTRLHTAGSPRIKTTLTKMLTAAAHGVASNATATAPVLTALVHELLAQGLALEEATTKRLKAAQQHASTAPAIADADASAVDEGLHVHLLVEFALQVLYTALRKGPLMGRAPDTLELLNALLPTLVRCLACRHAASVSLALRCMALLIDLPLPGLSSMAPAAGKAVTRLLNRTTRASHPVAQECFRLLAAMLRACPTYSPSTAQLRRVVGWGFADLQEPTGRQSLFGLLKAVLQRRLVVPEVYDVMQRVAEIMVQTHTPSLQQLCSQSFLLFLLDYPLGPRRLAGHVQFLLTNLSYQHESGRLAAMDMLATVVAKAPSGFVEEWGEAMALPLVTAMVADETSNGRRKAAEVLQQLLGVLSPALVERVVGYAMAWQEGDDARLRCASLQLLRVVVEVEGPRSLKRLPTLLPLLLPPLAHAADAADAADNATDDIHDARAAWQETYHALRLLEKLLPHASAQLQWDSGEEAQLLWEAVCALQLHPHLWVRVAAARLLAWALEAAPVGPAMLRATHGLAGRLAWQLVKQLETPGLDDTLGALAAGNLARMAPLLYEQDAALGRLAGEGEENKGSEGAPRDPALGVSLQWVASRVAQLAGLRAHETAATRRHALGLVAGLASSLGAARVAPVLAVLLRPLYRLSEGVDTEGDAAVQDVAAEKLLNPELAARAKLARRERRVQGKKRKLDDVRRQRDQGLRVKNRRGA